MSLRISLNKLASLDLRIQGEASVEDLDLVSLDELIHLDQPARYDLLVTKQAAGILVQGSLHFTLQCECARCLRAMEYEITLERWNRFIPLEGEERAEITGDCLDLTPYLREDILLEFPQHPLCQEECPGQPQQLERSNPLPDQQRKRAANDASAWAELNKLKL